MAEPYKVPDWLEAWEASSGPGHPEARSDPGMQDCPQCGHARHYQTCRRELTVYGDTQITKKECGCPSGKLTRR